jgi:hypothetical protein
MPRTVILFAKAAIPGGAAGDLFAMPVQVAGYTRGGTYVAPHTAIRHTAPAEAPNKPPPMDGAAQALALRIAGLQREMGAVQALSFTDSQLAKLRALGWIGPAVAHAYGAEIGNLTLTEAGRTAMARAVAQANEVAAPTEPPAPPADLAGGRATYPDGRMIPMPGDKVRRGVPGIFGMPIMLEGVVRGKTVQITSGATNRKVDALSPAWSVIGDPAVDRIAAERRAANEAEAAAKRARQDAEMEAREAERQALIAARGTLEGADLAPGDVIEDPEGVPHIVMDVAPSGIPATYPLGSDDAHGRTNGRLDGWRRLDMQPPPGSIIESKYGLAKRRTDAGEWEPVVWSGRRGEWVADAEFGPSLTDQEATAIALAATDFIARDREANRRERGYISYSRPGALDAVLEEQGRELRSTDYGRVLEQMGVIVDAMANGRTDELRAMRAEAPPEAAAPVEGRTAPAPAPPAVLIMPTPQPATPATGELLEAERAKLARYESGTFAAREDIVDLTRRRVNADPAKWRTGMGVTYKVASGSKGMQTNRGYRVVEVDPSNKMLRIRLIRDAGYADAMPGQSADQWIWMGEAQRAKADDAAELGPAPPRKPSGATIHEAYTMDYSSRIHFAKDGKGRVWKRMQVRDPRYGYKWGAWKLQKGDIPERATRTDQRARLPA